MDNNSEEKKPPGNLLVQLFFMLKLRSLAALTSSKRRRVHFVRRGEDTLQHLKELSQLLLKLSNEDVSRNTLFMTDLSSIWVSLETTCASLLQSSCDPLSLEGKLQHLLLSIKHYPKKDLYDLGYYLNQDIGPEWSPLPFMTMLRELHTDYREKEASSSLAIWRQILTEIVDEFPG